MSGSSLAVTLAVLAVFSFFTVLMLWATARAEPAFPGTAQRPPAPRQAGPIEQKSSGPIGAH